jgi:putative DNA primase/helicase
VRPSEIAELLGFRQVRPGQWEGRCPAHDDRNASAGLAQGDSGGTVASCQAGCSFAEIVKAAGLSFKDFAPPELARGTQEITRRGKIVARYDYRDDAGQLLYQVLRLEPKSFRQRRPDGDGGWEWSTKGVRRVLYRLFELANADPAEPVFVVEGEKDVERLVGLGLEATCNAGGAGKRKWPKSGRDVLADRHVVILPDNDDEGRKHARRIARALEGAAASIRIVELPGIAEKGDVSDWLNAGGGLEALAELVERAGEWDGEADRDDEPDHPNAPGAEEPPPVHPNAPESDGPPARGRKDNEPIEIAPWETEPLELADLVVRHSPDLQLARWRGEWFRYRGGYYHNLASDELEVRIRKVLKRVVVVEIDAEGLESRKSYRTSIQKVREVSKALEARGRTMISRDLDAPLWRERETPAPDLLIMRNGVLDLNTRRLLPHDPDLFAVAGVDYDYDPEAPPPRRWREFLWQLFGGDDEARSAIDEMLGLLLTNETKYQKIWMLIGPKRSGKGTILRTGRKLIGDSACVSSTLSSMAGDFGLAGWLNKKAAFVSDARLGGRADQAQITERLLSISGEDPMPVNRKYLPEINRRLQTRIVIASNELPRLNDASGALASRLILFRMTESFLGAEDHHLEDALAAELPGILLDALAGLDRVRKRGRLLQPASGQEAIEELEELTAPVAAFVRSELVVDPKDADLWIERKECYRLFKEWCETRGWSRPPTQETFGRDLSAAIPGVRRGRKRVGTSVETVYWGIGKRDGQLSIEDPPFWAG